MYLGSYNKGPYNLRYIPYSRSNRTMEACILDETRLLRASAYPEMKDLNGMNLLVLQP